MTPVSIAPKRLGQLLDLFRWCRKNWTHIAPTQEWIAKTLGWTLRTVQRAVAALKSTGMLRVTERFKRSALYELLSPAPDPQMTLNFAGVGVDGGHANTDTASGLDTKRDKQAERDKSARANPQAGSEPARQQNPNGGPNGGAELKPESRRVERLHGFTPSVVFLRVVKAFRGKLEQQNPEREPEWDRYNAVRLCKSGVPWEEAKRRSVMA